MHSAQRARALDRLASPSGVITGAACDHRDSLQAVLAKRGLELDDAGITELKLRVASVLAPAATMILLDAEYAAAQAIAAGAIPGATALVVPLEAMGYGDVAKVAQTAFLEGWSPQKARRLGASGAKLLLPYRADVPDQAARQEDVVRTAVAGCRDAGLGADRRADRLPPRRRGDGRRRPLRRARHRGRPPPGRARARRAQAAVPGLGGCLPRPSTRPAGGRSRGCCSAVAPSEDVIGGQIEDACRAGASGFIVGRTLFDAGLVVDPDESRRALLERSRPLLERLAAIAERLAVPWRERVGALPQPPREWYR